MQKPWKSHTFGKQVCIFCADYKSLRLSFSLNNWRHFLWLQLKIITKKNMMLFRIPHFRIQSIFYFTNPTSFRWNFLPKNVCWFLRREKKTEKLRLSTIFWTCSCKVSQKNFLLSFLLSCLKSVNDKVFFLNSIKLKFLYSCSLPCEWNRKNLLMVYLVRNLQKNGIFIDSYVLSLQTVFLGNYDNFMIKIIII